MLVKNLGIAVAAFALLSLGSCKGPNNGKDGGATSKPTKMMDGTASAPINLICPIMGEEIQEGGETSTVSGHTIAFCCDGCKDKFEAWSSDEKAEFVVKSMKK